MDVRKFKVDRKHEFVEISGKHRSILKLKDTDCNIVARKINGVYLIERMTETKKSLFDELFNSCTYEIYPDTISDANAAFWASYFTPEKCTLDEFYKYISDAQISIEDRVEILLDWNAIYNPHNIGVVLKWMQLTMLDEPLTFEFSDNKRTFTIRVDADGNDYLLLDALEEPNVSIRAVEVDTPDTTTIIFKSIRSLQWLYDLIFI